MDGTFALKLLQKRKDIAPTYEVPVDVRSEEEAVELLLAENAPQLQLICLRKKAMVMPITQKYYISWLKKG